MQNLYIIETRVFGSKKTDAGMSFYRTREEAEAFIKTYIAPFMDPGDHVEIVQFSREVAA